MSSQWPRQPRIAGLPKAPSQYNPIINPQLATGAAQLRTAPDAGCGLHRCRDRGGCQQGAHAGARRTARCSMSRRPYIAEMARLQVRQHFGAAAESAGYKVYTTIDGAAAGRGQPRGPDRAHRVRPPPRLSRTCRPRQRWRAEGRPEQLDSLVDEYSTDRHPVCRPLLCRSRRRAVRVYVKAAGLRRSTGTACHGRARRPRRRGAGRTAEDSE